MMRDETRQHENPTADRAADAHGYQIDQGIVMGMMMMW
jgi:hypothetical protein